MVTSGDIIELLNRFSFLTDYFFVISSPVGRTEERQFVQFYCVHHSSYALVKTLLDEHVLMNFTCLVMVGKHSLSICYTDLTTFLRTDS